MEWSGGEGRQVVDQGFQCRNDLIRAKLETRAES